MSIKYKVQASVIDIRKIQAAWEQVTSITVCADIIVNESTTDFLKS